MRCFLAVCVLTIAIFASISEGRKLGRAKRQEPTILQLFNFADKNNDGLVTAYEILPVMKKMYRGYTITLEVARQFVSEADTNRDSKLSLAEVKAILSGR